ncbi:LytR/AlgR family response regulator transcription factor [Proteiniphilum sp. UBA5280]|uniref:LytR/AlgR family response regulator transcription factor n=1 Tax=Proteiniphilum sp. UBA5280 TaxID=1947273 RepID=UPI00257EA0C0|nr:response regulator transcription factor [Proteiniphilum sp. UBA5280]
MDKKRFTAVAVDDEPVCLHSLRESLADYPEVTLMGEADTAKSGIKLVIDKKPDLLFLDVELPDMSGLELLREIQPRVRWPMKVVFYTSYQKYWLDALRESAFDYLLKPYAQEEFSTIMRRFFGQVARDMTTAVSLERALSELLPSHQAFMIPDITGYQMVRVNQVGYFSYSNGRRQWEAALANGKRVLLGRTVKSDHILSFSSLFVQISRNHIINIDHVCSIKGKACFLLPPFDNEKGLIISRNYLTNVHEKFRLL